MSIDACVAAVRRHVANADGTGDAIKKNLELMFARVFLARLRYECAQHPAEHVRHAHPEAYGLLARGLRRDAAA